MCTNCAKFCVFFLCIVLAVSSEQQSWTVYIDSAAEVIDKAKSSCVSCHDIGGKCRQKEEVISYLTIADEMIYKAKINFLTSNDLLQPILDCSDLLRMGQKRSGVYTISPRRILSEKMVFDVYCDMDTDGGGWTVIQRRGDFQNAVDYFYRDWKSYKEGFGDLEKEFWLGNEKIFLLTNQELYSVRFDLMDVENNTSHAHYDEFWIDDERSKYTLHISNYSGNAGDRMKYHNNQKFSAKDEHNDSYNYKCAEIYKGGWWYDSCAEVVLNGRKVKSHSEKKSPGQRSGVKWLHNGGTESLAWTEIKIRPKNFRSQYIYPDITTNVNKLNKN